MKTKITIFLTFLVVAMLLASCGTTNQNSGEGTTSASGEKEVFRVGLEAGYPPFNWTQMDDTNGAIN